MQTVASIPPVRWQSELQQALRDPAELWQILQLPPHFLAAALQAAQRFALRVPRSYVARMRVGDLNDPLLRQVLPLGEELLPIPGFSSDPVGDRHALVGPAVLHKYHGRALVITTGACAIHCRYCFRREFPYDEHRGALGTAWPNTLATLARLPDVGEIILSGGDPCMVSDERLALVAKDLAALPQIHTLRIHTRLPVVLPSRITDGLLRALTATRLIPVMVIHSNHAQELDDEVADALSRLRAAGIRLFNQTVLLRGINDDAQTLAALSRRVFELGVIPYYLHLLDRVQGAAHFEVPELEASSLYAQLEAQLPGYLVPRLVREVAGAPAKTRVR
ncbi:MAG: EF-P beta-lysylation protein EpmB [Gammaproteobacteria bacterium]|nr:EF-P beta-lysylation protein EpmB [Gammaproteobacteria bacterium]